MADLTRILQSIESGDPESTEELLPLVYEELRQLAATRMAKELPGQTLQPTALVHEAWLKLVGSNQNWRSRGHFFAAAAEAMRRILIDRARKRRSKRHGPGYLVSDIDAVDVAAETDDDTLLRIDEAFNKFALAYPEKAELIKLRFFVGLTLQESASLLGISSSTAKRQWKYARAWFLCELQDD